MSRALLDVNVLLALIDQDHIDHEIAHAWMDGQTVDGWASCAVTQNGFVRVLSQPNYPNPVTVGHAVELLRTSTSSKNHEFWPCDLAVTDPVLLADRLLGHRQVTDAYLLVLAVRHDGVLITLDTTIPVDAVRGAADRVVVLGR